jgi:hypothetical protein
VDEYVNSCSKMMAIFMPTDFKSLSINNFLKLQYPSSSQGSANESPFGRSHHLNIGAVESASSAMSNVASAPLPSMSAASEQNVKVRLCAEDDGNSNDSELSVGQEKVHSEQNESNNNVSVKEPASSDVDDEEMSNASSSQYTNSSTRLCSPQNSNEIMRPMHFHEEIIRSSQLYAEEILRQRIAAAARLQSVAVDSKSTLMDEPEPSIISKLSFQTGMLGSGGGGLAENGSSGNNNLFCAKSAINFQNIHSHLSAISQITHNLGGGGGGSSSLKKDDATSLSSLSRESSQSPSGFQQFKQHQQQKHLGFHTAAFHQNQFHDHSLKFSIDNILKADFGRRITEPLLKSSRLKRGIRGEGKHEKEKIGKFTDLETLQQKEPHKSTVTKDKSLDQSYSSSSAETSKGDAGTSSGNTPGSSSSGTVWPAWVNITMNKKGTPFFMSITDRSDRL